MNVIEQAAVPVLSAMLDAARSRTLQLIDGLAGGQWLGPRLAIVNPPLWELGHLGWFQEYWCLRRGQDGTVSASLLPQADALYDSAKVQHRTRWDLPLPDVTGTLSYLADVRGAVDERLKRDAGDPDLQYFAQLSVLHEEMHAEALTYTRQTLAYPEPATPRRAIGGGSCPGDVEIAGGPFHLGAVDDGAFVFDNEKWSHVVNVKPFSMARVPVTNVQFAEFVDAGGYREQRWWDDEGRAWCNREGAIAPLYWWRADNVWHRRYFDREEMLVDDEPVIHVNWHEAAAWCRWAGRRLPTEAEWEFAAATVPGMPGIKRRYPWGDAAPSVETANLYGTAGRCVPVGGCAAGDSAWGLRQMIGNVWEWTADWFQPYPGFVRDPYAEYSEPWFGNHKVLRGGCHATSAGLIRNTWRNFYTPDRRDVFAGFRSCAL
ncbi:MAG: ergothioneine biosynthesis protein EgtB [Burkholderiales bacterium]|jgi:iron(II)-dependent oxidoreductase|nr:ergothioneine biosynthesis protein EgtB [Burkholderiales bacterium]